MVPPLGQPWATPAPVAGLRAPVLHRTGRAGWDVGQARAARLPPVRRAVRHRRLPGVRPLLSGPRAPNPRGYRAAGDGLGQW